MAAADPAAGATFTDHSGPAQAVAFSRDGGTLATGSRIGAPRCGTPAPAGARRPPTAEAGDGVAVVDFSPDGGRVITAGSEPVFTTYSVRIWDVATPTAAARTLAVNFQPRSARYSPDGRYIAVCGSGVVLFEQEP